MSSKQHNNNNHLAAQENMQNANTTIPLFTHKSPDIDVLKTVTELDSIPNALNANDKEKYLMHKFYIASYLTINDLEYRIKNFHERMVSFIDTHNNLCLITDNYSLEAIQKFTDRIFKSCQIEIYHNPDRATNGMEFFYGDYGFEMHRKYVLILRVPYSNFMDKYNNSFEQFLIESAEIFHRNASQYIEETNKIGILHLFKYFYKYCVSFNPNSVLIPSQSYSNLFDVYSDMQDYFQFMVRCESGSQSASIYIMFTILYELYDKPWIKLKQIEECIQSTWNMIQQKCKFEYFESEIATCIIKYVHQSKPYKFEDFIHKQIDVDNEELNVLSVYGQYIHIYEKEYFKNYNTFFLNPFKWKYLENEELENVKRNLITNKTKPFVFCCALNIIGNGLKQNKRLDYHDITNKLKEFNDSDQITLNNESWKLFEQFDIYLDACVQVFHPWVDNL
eukprot:146824_1